MNNIFEKSKFGGALGTIGVLGGVFYAMKKDKSFAMTGAYAIGFGILGLILGNSITKFYE
jgi:hypothetical protein